MGEGETKKERSIMISGKKDNKKKVASSEI